MEHLNAYLLYLSVCCPIYAFFLYHVVKDDDITVKDAFLIMLAAFVPPMNLFALLAVIAHEFPASGSDFSDRVLFTRKRK